MNIERTLRLARGELRMNKERILGIAAALRARQNPPLNGEKLGFNMRHYIAFEDPPPDAIDTDYDDEAELADRTEHKCKTVGCIAGWTVAMYGTTNDRARMRRGEIYSEIEDIAADLLGLDFHMSDKLFSPAAQSHYWDGTPEEIAAGLEQFVATGEILWHPIKDLRK